MPVVTLSTLKGGVGKTTSALGLAGAAIATGQRAVVIDTDPQGGALDWAALAERSGVDCPEVRPAGAIDDPFDPGVWTIVDTPPAASPSRYVRLALERADLVVIPIAPRLPEVLRVGTTLEMISTHSDAPVALLLTRVRSQTRSPKDATESLVNAGHHVLATQIPLREAVSQAIGVPTVLTDLYIPVLHELVEAMHATEVST